MFNLTTLTDIKTKLIARGKTAEAVKIAIFATQEYPDSPSSWYHLGDAHFHNGNHESARAAINRSLALSPRDSSARALLTRLDRAAAHPGSNGAACCDPEDCMHAEQ